MLSREKGFFAAKGGVRSGGGRSLVGGALFLLGRCRADLTSEAPSALSLPDDLGTTIREFGPVDLKPLVVLRWVRQRLVCRLYVNQILDSLRSTLF